MPYRIRYTLVSRYLSLWALMDIQNEVNTGSLVLNSLKRKLRIGTQLSPDEVDIVSNVFTFSLLGEQGTTWSAGVRTLQLGDNVLRGRIPGLTAVVPLSPMSTLAYGTPDTEEYTELTYGEALFLQVRHDLYPARPLTVTSEAPVDALLMSFTNLGLEEALAFL